MDNSEGRRRKRRTITQRVGTLEKTTAKILKEMVELRMDLQGAVDSIQIASGGLQNRAGRGLERTIAGVFRYALGLEDVRPESVKLQQEIPLDGRPFKLDLVMHNAKTYIFEVSFYVDSDKAEKLEERVQAAIRHLGLKPDQVERVIVSLDRSYEALETARTHNILLIP